MIVITFYFDKKKLKIEDLCLFVMLIIFLFFSYSRERDIILSLS